MKKIFIQFRKWILRNRKKIVYSALALFVGQICFFGLNGFGIENHVYAADVQEQQDKVTEAFVKWKGTMSFFNKACNIFIYPMLVVAGYLVDNSFVYGEVFGFDAVLWQLRNIVKNLANFTLGFLFLYKIFKYLVGNGKEKIKDILLNALIAGIGIQASWFIMAALIDVSTILTYGVGGLPISMLEKSDEDNGLKENPYMMKTIISVNTKDMDTMNYYLTNMPAGSGESDHFYISECETFSYSIKNKSGSGSMGNIELILAPKLVYYEVKSGSQVPTDYNKCHYWGNIYYFSSLYQGKQQSLQNFRGEVNKFKINDDSETWENAQHAYKQALNNVKKEIDSLSGDDVKNLIRDGVVLDIGDAHEEGGVWGGLRTGTYSSEQKYGLDKYNKWTAGDGDTKTTSRLDDVLDGHSYVGVFSALYTSLVNSKEWKIVEQQGFFALLLTSALELGFTLAISIPLIVMAIIFMMRIGVLWLAIVLSPFIVLFSAFKDIGDKIFKNKMLENLKLENLIPIIFSPAIICFAISLCMVLVKYINGFNYSLSGVENGMNHQKILGGLVVLNVGTISLPIAKIIISVVGVAITWFLVWAAVESSKLGKSDIIKNLKGLATSGLSSIPLIPVPTKDGTKFVGTRAVFGGDGTKDMFSRKIDDIKSKYYSETNDLYEQMFGKDKDKGQLNVDGYSREVKNQVKDWVNWTDAQIQIGQGSNKEVRRFGDFEAADQDKIIEAINGMDNITELAKQGEIQEKVETKGAIYELKQTKEGNGGKTVYKYVKKEENTPQ